MLGQGQGQEPRLAGVYTVYYIRYDTLRYDMKQKRKIINIIFIYGM